MVIIPKTFIDQPTGVNKEYEKQKTTKLSKVRIFSIFSSKKCNLENEQHKTSTHIDKMTYKKQNSLNLRSNIKYPTQNHQKNRGEKTCNSIDKLLREWGHKGTIHGAQKSE